MTNYKIVMTPELRDLAFVPRWAIIRTNRQQNVAEHSYWVTVILLDMINFVECTTNYEPSNRKDMIEWALFHEAAETFTGDINGPAKSQILDNEKYHKTVVARETSMLGWSPRALNQKFSPTEQLMCRTADFIEALVFLQDEMKNGNPKMSVYDSLRRSLYETIAMFDNLVPRQIREAVAAYHGKVETLNFAPSAVNGYEIMRQPAT